MTRIEVFIDGSWLSHVCWNFQETTGFKLSHRRLPIAIHEHLKQVGIDGYVNVHYICSTKPNGQRSQKEQGFLKLLRRIGFNVIEHKLIVNNGKCTEKEVDMSVACHMLQRGFFTPNPFDVGVLITGDRDFVPALNLMQECKKDLLLVSYRNGTYRPTSRHLMKHSAFNLPPFYIHKHIDDLSQIRSVA